MRVLLLSRGLYGASICHRLVREGNEVLVWGPGPEHADTLNGIAGKVADLAQGLAWVGKGGLVVADTVGLGRLQDDLREQGYSVVGGSAGGDRLEEDRPWAQRLLAECGVATVPTLHVPTVSQAIAHVRAHPAPDGWVIKQNGHAESLFCYVGRLADGADVIDLLEGYRARYGDDLGIVLQRGLKDVEIGVGRYFNGRDWVGPIEMNVEHKKLFPGGLGPKTGEMGTLMWYDANEDNRLFRATLARLAPYLRQVGFRGDVDINCVVNENGAFPLEVTPRFGYPAFQLQTEFHVSPWAEFLKAVADGEDYGLRWRRGYGLVALLATPPFPYYNGEGRADLSPRGLKLRFHREPTEADWDHMHPEEVGRITGADGRVEYVVTGDSGHVLHVSALGATIDEARTLLHQRLANIVLPRSFYRNDLGVRFEDEGRAALLCCGWLT